MKLPTNIVILATAVAALQACSSVPVQNANLALAQADFKSASDSPAVQSLASNELREAQSTLSQAQDAWATKGNPSDVDHLAYLTSKRVAIARAVTRQRQAEMAVNEAQSQRQQSLLAARTAAATYAQRDAQNAQDIAAAATEQAQLAALQTAQAREETQLANANSAQLRDRLEQLNARQTERGMVVTIGDLLFDTNSAQLKPAAEVSIQRLGAFLKAYPMRNALIEGYTDSVGSTDRNQTLSERRATSVQSALAATGIGSERLTMHGYGESYPVGNNQSAEGRLTNRRVEVILSDDSGRVQPR